MSEPSQQTNGPGETPARSDLSALVMLSLPVVVTTVSRTVMGFVDFWMVSSLGTEQQAAVTPASLLVFCFISFGIGTMTCVNTFSAQALGRKTYSDASAYVWQAMYLSVGLGVLGLGLAPIAPTVFAWFGHEPAVQRLEIIYFTICVLSIGTSTAAAGLANFFIGIHRPSVTMTSAVGANVFNAVANYVLIFGGFGLVEPMGIAGAAWGTVLATIFRVVWLLAALLGPRYAREFATRKTLRLDLHRMRNLLRIGLPTSIQFCVEIVGWTVFVTWLVGQFGTADLAATNITFQYLHISFMPAVGVGIAINSLVGRAVGARDLAAAYRQVRIGARITMGYMAFMGLMFFVLRTPLVALFTDDPEIIAIGARVMTCAALFQVFDGMCITYNNSLRGVGDTAWPAAALLITFGLLGLGGGYAIARYVPQWGSLGPWLGGTAYITTLGLLLRWRWFGERWRHIDIFREPHGLPVAKAE